MVNSIKCFTLLKSKNTPITIFTSSNRVFRPLTPLKPYQYHVFHEIQIDICITTKKSLKRKKVCCTLYIQKHFIH